MVIDMGEALHSWDKTGENPVVACLSLQEVTQPVEMVALGQLPEYACLKNSSPHTDHPCVCYPVYWIGHAVLLVLRSSQES